MISLTLIQRLLIVLAAIALLGFAGQRRWITAKEIVWVGSAMTFCSTGWVLQSVLLTTEKMYPAQPRALWTAVGLTVPLVLSMSTGLFFLAKRLRKNEG